MAEAADYRRKSPSTETVQPDTAPGIDEIEDEEWDPEVEQLLEQAEETSGIDMRENISGAWRADLQDGAVAGTFPVSKSDYGGIDVENYLVMDNELLSRPYEEQNEALIHEYVHTLDHQEESETLSGLMDYAGFSDEAKEVVYDYMKFGSEAEKEAATEFLALNLNPDGNEIAGTFYPVLTSMISQDLFEMGEHPDHGIAEKLEKEKREIFGDLYRTELEDIGEDDWEDPYTQAYSEAVEKMNSYLEENGPVLPYSDPDATYGIVEEGNYEGSDHTGTPGEVAPNNSINWDGWDEKLEL